MASGIKRACVAVRHLCLLEEFPELAPLGMPYRLPLSVLQLHKDPFTSVQLPLKGKWSALENTPGRSIGELRECGATFR